jgi:hypothetical protein
VLPPTRALIDSGADCSSFPAQWASALGIDLANDCVVTNGASAGGQTTVHTYKPGITALFAGERVSLTASFNPALPIVLLGRMDFFAAYKVSFDQRRSTFRVESYD